ncbi:unnamed protein product [Pleuronectes platessa]|uniref:Uncharacterized protein n=1 Tax=Pleuronectes platessa TaxID=8262 RepID=A0A9N7ZEU2_PLEPL|nr:unnamed protein product [Pleuronectes platessa]
MEWRPGTEVGRQRGEALERAHGGTVMVVDRVEFTTVVFVCPAEDFTHAQWEHGQAGWKVTDGSTQGVRHIPALDQHRVTQSDLTQPGLIKAALRLGGPETQRSFCCPAQGVFPLEGERGAGAESGSAPFSATRLLVSFWLLLSQHHPSHLFEALTEETPAAERG